CTDCDREGPSSAGFLVFRSAVGRLNTHFSKSIFSTERPATDDAVTGQRMRASRWKYNPQPAPADFEVGPWANAAPSMPIITLGFGSQMWALLGELAINTNFPLGRQNHAHSAISVGGTRRGGDGNAHANARQRLALRSLSVVRPVFGWWWRRHQLRFPHD